MKEKRQKKICQFLVHLTFNLKTSVCVYWAREGLSCLQIWMNKVQRDIKLAKSFYHNDKINDLAQSNAKKWWQQIKSLTGQDAPTNQAWYHQFLNDGISDTVDLASKINDFFCQHNWALWPLSSRRISSKCHIPNELFVSEKEVFSDQIKQ